jgi:hypothetical protein
VTPLIALVLLCAGPEPIRFEDYNFQVTPQPDWERHDSSSPLHLRSGYGIVTFTFWKTPPKDLTAILKGWSTMEQHFKNPDDRVVGQTKLGGQPALVVEAKKGEFRLTWVVTRYGQHAYGFHYQRPVDSDTDEEAAAMRASFKFLRAPKKPIKLGETDKPIPAKRVTERFWKYECIKPEGMTQTDPSTISPANRAAGVVAEFRVKAEQTQLVIRILAGKTKQPIKSLAEDRIKRFEDNFKGAKEPVVDRKWKLKGARKTLHLALVGRKAQTVKMDWYLAEARNGFTYQFQVYRSGTGKWEKQIAAFLESFKIVSKTRLQGP